jgi:hypothetical protein
MRNDFAVYSVLVIFLLGGINLFGSIYSDKIGKDIEVFSNINNPETHKIYDLKVRAMLIDDGYVETSNFNIGGADTDSANLVYEKNQGYKGDYLVKVTVRNDDVQDTKYVFVDI